MKITIDTDLLKKEGLSIGEFLVLLIVYYNIDITKVQESIDKKKWIDKNLFDNFPPILSDNAKDKIANILVSSDKYVSSSEEFFNEVADEIRKLYPNGKKPGTSYLWKDSTSVIVQKLKTLVAKYKFHFTKEEAISATQEYVNAFKDDVSHMRLLKYFILKNDVDADGNKRLSSEFMSIIENKRDNETCN